MPSDVFNTWRGFAVNPRRGDWSLMEAHIKDVLCCGDENLYRYVRCWLANAVQHPGKFGEVALVLRGIQGTGKSIFAHQFGALFGQHYLCLSQARQLTGNFNAHLEDAIVVLVDEAFLAGDAQAEGRLKALITEPTITIERKGIDSLRIPAKMNADSDDAERRFRASRTRRGA
jgi:hypothetical protein